MNLFTFIYIIGIFILLNIFEGFKEISIENQLIYSSLSILLFGIPHGAIDHIIFFKKRKITQLKFYLIYLGLIVAFVTMWHITPVLSLIFFLLISAFHFGESQFEDIKLNKFFKNTFYFFWGVALLSTLIFYNIKELANVTAYFDDTLILEKIYDIKNVSILFYFTNTVLLFQWFYWLFLIKLKLKDYFLNFFCFF